MKKLLILRSGKWLVPLLAIVILAGLTSCTSTETTTTPEIQYAPVISFVNSYITEAGGSASGVNVSFFTRISERPDMFPVNIIYYFDATPPTTPGLPAYSGPGTYVVQEPVEDPVIWKDITPGRHVFSAQLVKPDDNSPLDPPVTAQCIITVPSVALKSPELRIVSTELSLPLPESAKINIEEPLPYLQVQVTSSVHNFKLNDDKIGKQNASGEGHVIYYLDTEPPTAPGQSATTDPGTFKATTNDFHLWEDVPAGRHVFSIQLVNNDNTPLDPPVIAQIIITLPSKI